MHLKNTLQPTPNTKKIQIIFFIACQMLWNQKTQNFFLSPNLGPNGGRGWRTRWKVVPVFSVFLFSHFLGFNGFKGPRLPYWLTKTKKMCKSHRAFPLAAPSRSPQGNFSRLPPQLFHSLSQYMAVQDTHFSQTPVKHSRTLSSFSNLLSHQSQSVSQSVRLGDGCNNVFDPLSHTWISRISRNMV